MKFDELDKKLQIYANLFRVSNKLQVTMDKNLDEITAKQWYTLAFLNFYEGEPTLKEISKALGYSHQNTKQLLNKLEEKGFIKFEVDSEDKRYIRIYTTEKVKDWERRNVENSNMFLELLFSEIPEEHLDIVSSVLNEFYERLEQFYEKA